MGGLFDEADEILSTKSEVVSLRPENKFLVFSQEFNFLSTRSSGRIDSTCDNPAENFDRNFFSADSPKKLPTVKLSQKEVFQNILCSLWKQIFSKTTLLRNILRNIDNPSAKNSEKNWKSHEIAENIFSLQTFIWKLRVLLRQLQPKTFRGRWKTFCSKSNYKYGHLMLRKKDPTLIVLLNT